MADNPVRIERDGDVAVVVLDSPPLNLFDEATFAGFETAVVVPLEFVAETRTEKLPQLYLWEPESYKDKVNSFTLYFGIVIGIAGLLALFLTILFVVKSSVMFPASAALGWAVLAYIGTDFGFWGKVFNLSIDAERVWRASGEAILAATLPAIANFGNGRAGNRRRVCAAQADAADGPN